MLKKIPNVYIGAVKNKPISEKPIPDDDEDSETPQEVKAILGFDPDSLPDSESE